MSRRRRTAADGTADVAPQRVRLRDRIDPRTVALGALVLVSVALFSVLVPLAIGLYGEPPAYAFLFGAILCGAPLLALRSPRWSVLLFTIAAVVLPLPVAVDGGTPWPWPWSVPALLALVLFVGTLTVVHGWRSALLAWLLSIGGTLVVAIAGSGAVPVAAGIVNLVIVTSISGAALLVAVLVASRMRVGAELTRERALGAQEHDLRVAVEERARIARELHDVVAHGMSLIQVQASTARYRLPELPTDAVSEFDEIARTARASLTEMRRLLGVLRTEGQEADLAPQQGVRDIPSLVESARRTGAVVDFTPPAVSESVPPAVDIAAYRIVQEALSNARRHAAGARVDVTVDVDGDAVRIRVHSAAPAGGAPPAAPGGGHGIRGMRERAALAGGILRAGADPDGGWTVRAELPLEEHV
ncbi:sensor histidine kinase [Microbacterium sp. ASV49]|uniref:histidine kinase n=1 Tax=Microbacterium candidum TaxID=3041922 RepID=A0ABT7MZK3_9MICO|nr:histidine kinase [Microbacterium sp. ASV49]MDL9979885.1 histidine kinase [Microbacterium sp. ASV49]